MSEEGRRLDSPQACIEELTDVNAELAEFGERWGKDAGELAGYERRYQRAYKAAMKANPGGNADARSAIALEAVEEVLGKEVLDRMPELDASATECEKRFKALDRRASNAQSILAALRDEAQWKVETPDGMSFGGRGARRKAA